MLLYFGRRLEEHLRELWLLVSEHLDSSEGSFLQFFVLKLFIADIEGKLKHSHRERPVGLAVVDESWQLGADRGGDVGCAKELFG